MASSSNDSSPTSSCTSSPVSDQRVEDSLDDSFWMGLARRAKSVMEDGVQSRGCLEEEQKDSFEPQRKNSSNTLTRQQNQNHKMFPDGKWKRQDSVALQKGLEAIASSLSLLSDTLGTALEEGLNLVEKKATNFIYTEPPKKGSLLEKKVASLLYAESQKKNLKTTPSLEKKCRASPTSKFQVDCEDHTGPTKDTQLKASRDVAMAMATKAKLLLRELKNVKADLTFTQNRCAQLEEENKRLRECVEKGVRHEEDDLVRLQLEALLAEKARLTQENAAYARENQFLHEIVQYHQLKLRSVALADEILMSDMAELDMDGTVDLEFLPDEKDIVALEESVKIADQQGFQVDYSSSEIQKPI